jgi:hypothetical protein
MHTGRKLPAHKKVNPPLPPPISTLTFCSVSFQAFTVLSQACLAGRQEAASSQKFKSSIHLLLHPSLPSPSVLCPCYPFYPLYPLGCAPGGCMPLLRSPLRVQSACASRLPCWCCISGRCRPHCKQKKEQVKQHKFCHTSIIA